MNGQYSQKDRTRAKNKISYFQFIFFTVDATVQSSWLLQQHHMHFHFTIALSAISVSDVPSPLLIAIHYTVTNFVKSFVMCLIIIHRNPFMLPLCETRVFDVILCRFMGCYLQYNMILKWLIDSTIEDSQFQLDRRTLRAWVTIQAQILQETSPGARLLQGARLA